MDSPRTPIRQRTRETLNRYQLPELASPPKHRVRYDGRMEWNLTDSLDSIIYQFRMAVLQSKKSTIEQILNALQNITPGQVDRLVTLILDRSSAEPTKEALLTAICIGSRPLVEFILALFYEFPGEERVGCKKSKTFPSHMTPLMLACICNNFAIVQCLLLRKHYIRLPHRPDCFCEQCMRAARCMANSIILLDTYRAISSEPFLWLASTDPLLAAFNLAMDLEVCEELEREYKVAYGELRESVMAFTVKVVEQCWTSEEIETLLSCKVGSPLTDCELRYPRVQLALKAHMKSFLASLGVQTAMEGHWYGMWTDYGRQACQDLSRQLRHFFFYPVLATFHSISGGQAVKTFKYPLARYISRLASYILFLVVLIFIRYFGREGERASERTLVDSNLRLVLESYVYLYVYGMAVTHFIEFAHKGLETFYDVWWRWFDLILIWLFSGSFFCWVMTAATISQDRLPRLHRRHWISYDFSIIYDIYFGCASVMALWRILYYFQLHRNIGSTVISISRCIYHVVLFLSISAILMVCFSLGINTMYQAYNENRVVDKDGNLVLQKETYASLGITFRNLYWSFYGYLAPWDYKIIVGNAGPKQEPTEHPITNYTGEIVIAAFHIAVVITLLNLMISMLVRTADDVLKNEDMEWKFTRCHIFSEYFEWFTAIPPPFNLIYNTTSALYRSCSKKFHFACPDLWVQVKNWNPPLADLINQDQLYLKLMRLLFERFRFAQEYHYKTVMKADVEKFVDPEKQIYRQLAFMNSGPELRKVIDD